MIERIYLLYDCFILVSLFIILLMIIKRDIIFKYIFQKTFPKVFNDNCIYTLNYMTDQLYTSCGQHFEKVNSFDDHSDSQTCRYCNRNILIMTVEVNNLEEDGSDDYC